MKRLLSTCVLVGMLICSNAAFAVVINSVRHWSGGMGVEQNGPSYVQLYNPGPADVNLTGWTLASPGWSFVLPAVSLPSEAYLFIVLDSGGCDDNGYYGDSGGFLSIGTAG